MDERAQRGLQIAALSKITQKGAIWLVPSQTHDGSKYTVCPDPTTPHCTCPDHETRGVKCKHIFAVEFVIQRETHMDGSTTQTTIVAVTEKISRPTYAQNWTAYNAAQTNEKAKFQELLHDLCSGIQEPPQKTGRPRISLADMIFSACFKVYSTVSCRRFMTDLREAQAKGHISKTPHFNSIFNYLENPELEPILHRLIAESALPLKAIETTFAVDSSGFSTSRFVRWFDKKYGVVREQHHWIKAHLMCGVQTNVVTSVEIAPGDGADCPFLPGLVKNTARNFHIDEVLADKGYSSAGNHEIVAALGAVSYIPFRSNATGGKGGLWQKMFHYFSLNREEFLRHYHKRSNIESTFSMMKAKFRDHLRSKGDAALRNELLCKVLCHNICCLIQEMYELGVEPSFWAEKVDAQKLA